MRLFRFKAFNKDIKKPFKRSFLFMCLFKIFRMDKGEVVEEGVYEEMVG